MPELPEVESFRQRVAQAGLQRKIEHVRFRDADEVLHKSGSTIRDHLLHRELTDTARHGKYLFAKAGDDGWLVLHFGMTGDVHVLSGDEDPAEYEYRKMQLDFDDGGSLVYVCPRKLGRLDWTATVEEYVQQEELGPGALQIDWEEFRERIAGRHTAIKSALMDQSSLAGIGNLYSDEILFHAGIRPARHVADLDDSELRDVFDKMKHVLPIVTEHYPDLQELRAHYLVANREEGADCPRCGGTLEKTEISGRSSYWCPQCQS